MKDIDDNTIKNAITWVANIAKQGDARIITIPKNYWRNNIVDENKTYQIYLVELGEKKEKT